MESHIEVMTNIKSAKCAIHNMKYPKHNKDKRDWYQEEVEMHLASLESINPCYYCLAEKREKVEEKLIVKVGS